MNVCWYMYLYIYVSVYIYIHEFLELHVRVWKDNL